VSFVNVRAAVSSVMRFIAIKFMCVVSSSSSFGGGTVLHAPLLHARQASTLYHQVATYWQLFRRNYINANIRNLDLTLLLKNFTV